MFPSAFKHPKGSFDFANEGFGAKSSSRNLRFKSGKFTYVVYSSTYAFGTDAAGVSSKSAGAKVRYVPCRETIAESDFYLLQNLGLPKIARDAFVFEP